MTMHTYDLSRIQDFMSSFPHPMSSLVQRFQHQKFANSREKKIHFFFFSASLGDLGVIIHHRAT
jgi:hypothetical protein